MTALGRRITVETVRNLRDSMPPGEFARELMGWWSDPPNLDGDGVIDLEAWAALADPSAAPSGQVALVIDVEPSRKSSTIGIASRLGGKTLVVPYVAGGTAWVAQKVADLKARGDVAEVALHPSTQAGALIPQLTALGVEFHSLTTQQVGAACADFQAGVKEGRIVQPGVAEMDAAVRNATTRFVGEVEVWDRRDHSISISPVVACSTAAYRLGLLDTVEYDVLDSVH